MASRGFRNYLTDLLRYPSVLFYGKNIISIFLETSIKTKRFPYSPPERGGFCNIIRAELVKVNEWGKWIHSMGWMIHTPGYVSSIHLKP